MSKSHRRGRFAIGGIHPGPLLNVDGQDISVQHNRAQWERVVRDRMIRIAKGKRAIG